jgi:hypothetical protein
MSTKITFVAAALAALTLGLGAAQANIKGPSSPPQSPSTHAGGAASQATQNHCWSHHNYYAGYTKCYWLPTVSNGSVSGLEQKCIWVKS